MIRDKIVATEKIAKMLGFTTREAATALCRSGRLKTAKKLGNAWVAEIWEVVHYRDVVMKKGRRKPAGPNKTKGEL